MKNSGELRIAKDAPWEELYDLVREMAGIGELTGSDDMVDESMLLCLCVFKAQHDRWPLEQELMTLMVRPDDLDTLDL